MPTYLVLTSFGFFTLDKNGEVVSRLLTYPDVGIAASEIEAIGQGEATEKLGTVAENLKKLKVDNLIVENSALARTLAQITEIPISTEEDSSVVKWFRDSQDSILIESGVVESKAAIDLFGREVSIQLARAKITAASEEKDLLVKHAIDAIGEIDKSINVLVMRLREWYSLHHPSLSGLVEDQDVYSKIVEACGGRAEISRECLSTIGLSDPLIDSVIESAGKDIGAPLQSSDLDIIRAFSSGIQSLYEKRMELEDYVTTMMNSVAPNITMLVGALVGARLISLAGSLKELAQKPSSTVQIFGAERALFRSLKSGADPPKHGIIYQVPEIHTAPYWQRGKIARALAGKVSIAARIDAYTKRNVGESLREKFLERVEEIRKQNVEAPPPKPPKKRTSLARKDRGKAKKKRGRGR